jgi:hypothetical protein
MLHPFGIASRDDFGKKTVDQNNAGALTLAGGSTTLEPDSGRSCAEFQRFFSNCPEVRLRDDALSHWQRAIVVEHSVRWLLPLSVPSNFRQQTQQRKVTVDRLPSGSGAWGNPPRF